MGEVDNMTTMTRRAVTKLLGASAAAIAAWPAAARGMQAQPARGAYLIRGGTVITVDRSLGTLPKADVLIRSGVIEKVGTALQAASNVEVIDATGMIVMPGMVDTHCHLWETIGRNFLNDDAGYFPVMGATARLYTPDDFYNSVMIGLAECAASGVTTVNNFAHNALSPAHVEAELRAHRDSMLRARYSYGRPLVEAPIPAAGMPFGEIERVKREWLGTADRFDGLVHLGVNLSRQPGQASDAKTNAEVFDADVKAAAARQLPISVHAPYEPPVNLSIQDYAARGYLGPNFLVVHHYPGSLQDFETLARTGTPLSLAPYTLASVATDPHVALTRLRKAGVTVSLSSDAAGVGPLDMLEIMRLTWSLGNRVVGPEAEGMKVLGFLEAIEMATINGARALGLDKVIGSLTPGKRADVALIRASAVGVAPMALPETTVVLSARSSNVDTVFADGRIVKRGGTLTTFDGTKLVAAAQASALRIRKEAGRWLSPPPK
jgi:5-methylthioadenosine/S-adenosylhomocysteine deaminase